jgi:F420-non-reducing hydrogenase iron-sulfur subunit
MYINPKRVRLDWVSAGEGEKYALVTTEFTEAIRKLGPFKLEELKQEKLAAR